MNNFIIKARLILEKEGKVLLLSQTSENGGKFTLPGGTVEGAEFAKETLIRECEEEIGIILNPNDLDLIHVLHKKKGKDNRITIYFKAQNYEGTLHAKETDKFKGVTWSSIHRLPVKTSVTVKHVLGQVKMGEQYSELSKKSGGNNGSRKMWNW